MADDNRAIVRAGSKQRVKSVISHAPHCFFMMSAETNDHINDVIDSRMTDSS